MAKPKTQKAKGNWKKFKGRIQESWGTLSGDDLDRYEGKREQLEGHIMEKTGETREAVQRKLDRLEKDRK